MRRISLTVTAALVLAAVIAPGAVPASAAPSGCPTPTVIPSGSAGSYTISTPYQLQYLWDNRANSTWRSSTITLTADIDMSVSGTCTWTSGIGTSNTAPFYGTFDGAGHLVKNLDVTNNTSTSTSPAALFGYVNGGTIKNLGYLDGTVRGNDSVGSLVGNTGASGADVQNSYSNVTVTATGQSVGGLVGAGTARISNCYSTGTVTAGGNYVGGLIGDVSGSGTITNSYASGYVSGGLAVGGLIGLLGSGTVTNSFFYYDATVTGHDIDNSLGTATSLAGMTTLATFTGTTPSWSIGANYDNTKTWGICSSVNSGYPFLTTFYASDPCTPASPTPAFDTPVSTADGFTVNVTNYDALYTWAPTATSGSVAAGTASGSTLPLTVTGLSAGAADTITVTTSRTGYADGTATVDGSALTNALTPTFDTPVSTADGFTVNVTNYDALYTWTPTVTSGSVSAGTASGSTLPLTVTGLSAGAADTITVTTSRTGYADGSATVDGTALVARASASPSAVSFGVQEVGTTSATQTVTFTSSGTADLEIGADAASISGTDAAMFTIETDNCSGQTLTPSQSCTVEVSFTPASTGEKSATLTVASNDPSSPTSVPLAGGETTTPPPATFIFQFVTPAGGTCLPSVHVTDGQVYTLPGATVPCVPAGSTLVGWSIPGQHWNFSPAGEVVVSGDQVFTAAALNPTIEITIDANVGMDTACLNATGDVTVEADRSQTTRLPRADASLPTTAPCAPEGFRLIGWTDQNTPDGSSRARAEARTLAAGAALPASWNDQGQQPTNAVHLYALWQRS